MCRYPSTGAAHSLHVPTTVRKQEQQHCNNNTQYLLYQQQKINTQYKLYCSAAFSCKALPEDLTNWRCSISNYLNYRNHLPSTRKHQSNDPMLSVQKLRHLTQQEPLSHENHWLFLLVCQPLLVLTLPPCHFKQQQQGCHYQ